MPEGAEVRRIVDQMNLIVAGKHLSRVRVLSGRYQKQLPYGLTDFLKQTHEIVGAKNKGKFIYFETSTEWNIWNTLGMSGSWSKDPNHEFNRVIFEFEDLEPIYFSDIRNFGTLKFVNSKKELKKKLMNLGPDPIIEDVSDAIFKTKIKNRGHKTLPEILMDQSMMAGVGNYVKAEALYLAKISPHRIGNSLSDLELSTLNRAIHSVLRESYRSGGSTFRTYADFNGETGNFTDRFMVYGRKEDPDGNEIMKEETKDGRTTHWVPAVQK